MYSESTRCQIVRVYESSVVARLKDENEAASCIWADLNNFALILHRLAIDLAERCRESPVLSDISEIGRAHV